MDTSLPAERVSRVLDTLIAWRGHLSQRRMGNFPELISRCLASWAKVDGVAVAHFRTGKPADAVPVSFRENACIERFNRTFRGDVLDACLNSSLEEVRPIIEALIEEYCPIRPHHLLQGTTPCQFATQDA